MALNRDVVLVLVKALVGAALVRIVVGGLLGVSDQSRLLVCTKVAVDAFLLLLEFAGALPIFQSKALSPSLSKVVFSLVSKMDSSHLQLLFRIISQASHLSPQK